MPPGVDRIGALPDEILHHLLSILPAQEAVRTCVLAQRWRHLWKSTPALRIVGAKGPGSVRDLRKFVDHLLILRDPTDLQTVLIKFIEFREEDVTFVNLWIRFAAQRKVRTLTFLPGSYIKPFHLDGMPFASPYLTKLYIYNVRLNATLLDFSTCPALEFLKLVASEINVSKIALGSVKHLQIILGRSFLNHPVRVSAPCLVSLKFDGFSGITPLLERMPLLEAASLNLGVTFMEPALHICRHYRLSLAVCGTNDSKCESCLHYNSGSSNGTVLLRAIYNAKHLKLISSSPTIISPMDLKSCPTFKNLKNLLLNDCWCEGPDFNALSCILKHSPLLENLTLQLVSEGKSPNVEIKGRYSPTERYTIISRHLKTVYVKCYAVDEKVTNVLKFLSTLNLQFSYV